MLEQTGLSAWRLALATAALNIETTYFVVSDGRSILGHHRAPPSIQTLIADGPFIAVRAGGRTGRDQIARTVEYSVPVDVWLGASRETGDSLLEIEEYIESLCDAFEELGYVNTTFEEPEIKDENEPVIVHYEIRCAITDTTGPCGTE